MGFIGRIGFGLSVSLVTALIVAAISYWAYAHWLQLDPNTLTGFVMVFAFFLLTLKASVFSFFAASRPHAFQTLKTFLKTVFSKNELEYWTPPEPFDTDNGH